MCAARFCCQVPGRQVLIKEFQKLKVCSQVNNIHLTKCPNLTTDVRLEAVTVYEKVYFCFILMTVQAEQRTHEELLHHVLLWFYLSKTVSTVHIHTEQYNCC